jgi:hypothetical protein
VGEHQAQVLGIRFYLFGSPCAARELKSSKMVALAGFCVGARKTNELTIEVELSERRSMAAIVEMMKPFLDGL